jgi:hypothetical protein
MATGRECDFFVAGGLRLHDLARALLTAPPDAELADEIMLAIRSRVFPEIKDARPQVLVTFSPAGTGGNWPIDAEQVW